MRSGRPCEPKDCPSGFTRFLCAKNQDCLNLLLRQSRGSSHIFTDICDAAPLLAEFQPDATFAQKNTAIQATSICTSAWCLACKCYCPWGPTQVDTSWSPCQDFSRLGNREGRGGSRIHLLLLWIRWHLVWQTPLVIHENVPEFDLEIIEENMSKDYHIFSVFCGPGDVGFAFCRRPRMYLAMTHKRKTRVHHNPVQCFWALCGSLTSQRSTLETMIVASPQEVRQDQEFLAADRKVRPLPWFGPIRPGVRHRQGPIGRPGALASSGFVDHSSGLVGRSVEAERHGAVIGPLGLEGRPSEPGVLDAMLGQAGSEGRPSVPGTLHGLVVCSGSVGGHPNPGAQTASSWHLLSRSERAHLREYMELWRQTHGTDPEAEPALVVNLGDNPGSGFCGWSAPTSRRSGFVLPVLRKGWTAMWLPSAGRWLSMGERLAVMGFPAYPAMAPLYGLQVPFSVPWKVAKHAVGNAMHVANVGVWQAVVAACVTLE